MAIDYGTSLDAGASDITYSGDEGPKSPKQIAGGEYNRVLELIEKVREGGPLSEEEKIELQQLIQTLTAKGINVEELIGEELTGDTRTASADPMLQDEYDKYVFELQEMHPEAVPMSIEQFKQQAVSSMANGGRIGFQGGGIFPGLDVLGSGQKKGILPRIGKLGSGVSSAEQELQDLNQRLGSAQTTLGHSGNGPSMPGGPAIKTLEDITPGIAPGLDSYTPPTHGSTIYDKFGGANIWAGDLPPLQPGGGGEGAAGIGDATLTLQPPEGEFQKTMPTYPEFGQQPEARPQIDVEKWPTGGSVQATPTSPGEYEAYEEPYGKEDMGHFQGPPLQLPEGFSGPEGNIPFMGRPALHEMPGYKGPQPLPGTGGPGGGIGTAEEEYAKIQEGKNRLTKDLKYGENMSFEEFKTEYDAGKTPMQHKYKGAAPLAAQSAGGLGGLFGATRGFPVKGGMDPNPGLASVQPSPTVNWSTIRPLQRALGMAEGGIARLGYKHGGIMGSNAGSMLVAPTRDGSRPGYAWEDEFDMGPDVTGEVDIGGGEDNHTESITNEDLAAIDRHRETVENIVSPGGSQKDYEDRYIEMVREHGGKPEDRAKWHKDVEEAVSKKEKEEERQREKEKKEIKRQDKRVAASQARILKTLRAKYGHHLKDLFPNTNWNTLTLEQLLEKRGDLPAATQKQIDRFKQYGTTTSSYTPGFGFLDLLGKISTGDTPF